MDATPNQTATENQQRFMDLMLSRKAPEHLILNWACASGKTVAIQSHLQLALRKRYRRAVIIVPTETIRHGWRTDTLSDYHRTIVYSDRSVMLDVSLVREVTSPHVRAQVLTYLSEPKQDHAIVVCSRSWSGPKSIGETLQRGGFDLEGTLFVFDEHHTTATSRDMLPIFRWLVKQGAHTIGATATLFRLDGEPVRILGSERILHWSHLDQVSIGRAPKNLETSFTPVEFNAERATLDMLVERAANSLVQAVTADAYTFEGKKLLPKFIVQIPGQPQDRRALEEIQELFGETADTSTTYRIARLFAERLRIWMKRHAHPVQRNQTLLDVTDREDRDAESLNFLTTLSDEKKAPSWRTSKVLGIVGCLRIVAGVDWKFCSNIYRLGLSQSMVALLQLLGRGQRPKDLANGVRGYPRLFKDTTAFRVVVPVRQDEPIRHLDALLKMSLTLSDLEHSNVFARLVHQPKSTAQGVLPRHRGPKINPKPNKGRPFDPPLSTEAQDALITVLANRDEISKHRADLFRVWVHLQEDPSTATYARCRALLASYGRSPEEIDGALREALRGHGDDALRDLRDVLRESTEGGWNSPRAYILGAFHTLLEKYEASGALVSFEDVPGFVIARKEIARFSPETLRAIREEFRYQLQNIDPAFILQAAERYRKRHGGRNPAPDCQDVVGGDLPRDRWCDLHAILQKGRRGLARDARGLPGFFSLHGEWNEIESLEIAYENRLAIDPTEFLTREGNPEVAALYDSYLLCRSVMDLERAHFTQVVEPDHRPAHRVCLDILGSKTMQRVAEYRLRRIGAVLRRRVQLGQPPLSPTALKVLRDETVRARTFSLPEAL